MKPRASHGYTILEVMIFLAISGVLFASAVVAVGGNQSEVQYSQAVRDFEIQIKDVINDVANGYYPPYGNNTRCEIAGASGNIIFPNNASDGPGSNQECINIGKNVMFNLSPTQIGVGTLVGINPSIGQSPDLSLVNLNPTMAFENGGLNQIDITTYKPVRYGAVVTKIGSDSYSSETYSTLFFISDFSTSANGGTRTDGTLAVNTYGYVGNLTSNSSLDQYRREVEDLATATPAQLRRNPPEGFYICLRTTDDRRARVFVGVDGVVTATKTEFDLTAGGVCP